MKLYHITDRSRLPRIRLEGLQPTQGPYIYFWENLWVASKIAPSWHEDPVILAVTVAKDRVEKIDGTYGRWGRTRFDPERPLIPSEVIEP